MALGTNYKRTQDKEDKRRESNLDKHWRLMQKYISEGMSKEDASKKAYDEILGGTKWQHSKV